MSSRGIKVVAATLLCPWHLQVEKYGARLRSVQAKGEPDKCKPSIERPCVVVAMLPEMQRIIRIVTEALSVALKGGMSYKHTIRKEPL